LSEGGVFNIGSQKGGTINQAGRDQFIGESHGSFVAGALDAVSELSDALAATGLKREERQQSETMLREVDAELRSGHPDKSRIAGNLQRLSDALASAGVLATSADRLLGPLKRLAGLLGDAGGALLRTLG
jgi:hypothetical protein